MAENDCDFDGEERGGEEFPDPLQDLLLNDIEVSGRELGVGSYSSVLELHYKGLKCAGKKLHRSLYEQNMAIGPEILERFGVECELLSQLKHPKIVQFLGLHFEEGSDVPILILEFMSSALSDSLEKYGTLSNEISFSILHDVSLGLHYLHTHSPAIIHRDLTANNILLTRNMTAKISDLGMAKILNITPALMTRRMTVCPGTISYMPPEALTSEPLYDTKLDCFSFGVLATHIFCGEWPIASEYLQPDPNHPGHLYPLTEIQRREKYLKRLGKDHPLMGLIQKCLNNLPSERPDAVKIFEDTRKAALKYSDVFENRVDMLNQINSDRTEKEQLQSDLEALRCTLHEREHTIETITMAYNVETEQLKEKVMRLEQMCALQDMQLSQLQAENSRIQLLLASKREELALQKKREKTLSSELLLANTKLEEKAAQSLEKLKKLQADIVGRSEEREKALKRLSSDQLEGVLKVSLGSNRTSAQLSKEYEDFFLNNADDIAELLIKSPKSSSSNLTNLQAHQIVCSMIQYCYDHCKAKVMDASTKHLNNLFSMSPDIDHTSLHDLSIAYGLLVKEGGVSLILVDNLCQEIFPKFIEKHSLRLASRSTEASLRHHMTHACKLTLDLVCAWPPLIVSKPNEFYEEWHDREFQHWEKSSPSRSASSTITRTKLLYTRPVLFSSYKGEVGAKGWVGNRDKELAGSSRTSHDRVSRKMRNGT